MSESENLDEAPRTAAPLSQDVLEYEQTVRTAVSGGQLLTAIEVAREGLKRFGTNRVLQQQLALALAQTGALDGAREQLGAVLKETATDVETLCLLGRVHKELWRRTQDKVHATEALRQSSQFYGEAFKLQDTYYPGINLAFTLAALGQLDEARAFAQKVEKFCRIEISQTPEGADGWLLATLAEALTHQGLTTEAAQWYQQAAKKFAGRWRDLASMRRQAREIAGFYAAERTGSRHHWYDLASIRQRVREALGQTEAGLAWIDRCFEFPSIVVFSGHMIDGPERKPPRFPAAEEAAVREQIRTYLRTIKPGFGYSSAACGADLIFCECLLELGAKVNLVLPCPINAFKRQSVSVGGADWEQRFHQVLGQAENYLVANPVEYAAFDHDPAATMGLVYANRIMTGLAVLQAQALDFELHALAVWDGHRGDLDGGTGSVVAEWEARRLPTHIISPDAPGGATIFPLRRPPSIVLPKGVTHQIKAMLFADVLNYRKIGERQMPAFIQEFKGAVGQVLGTMPHPPLVSESWNDALYFVYDNLPDAANFALELRDLIGSTDWAARGLPADLGVRIVLHAGPVFAFTDPVLRRPACVGSHVTRASRIEPITPVGQVYASQEFAALCSAEDLAAVSFEFLGRIRTANLMEEAPLYRLDRRPQPEGKANAPG